MLNLSSTCEMCQFAFQVCLFEMVGPAISVLARPCGIVLAIFVFAPRDLQMFLSFDDSNLSGFTLAGFFVVMQCI